MLLKSHYAQGEPQQQAEHTCGLSPHEASRFLRRSRRAGGSARALATPSLPRRLSCPLRFGRSDFLSHT